MSTMNLPPLKDVQYERTDQRLKVVMPAERNHIFFGLYTLLMLVWLGVTVWMLVLLFGTSLSGLSTTFLVVWLIIMLVWAYVWFRLGRSVWRWWQFYAATREILFIDEEILIIRRPLSILGVTDAYDMEHVSPFYYSEKNGALAFDYGSRGGLFGRGLERGDAEALLAALNRLYFPEDMAQSEGEAAEGELFG